MFFVGHRAFTLIELLIVVAIIAILAAIAVPNFLEAQTRAKVAREKSELRTLDVALMAYYVDNNEWVPWRGAGIPPRNSIRFHHLTTPIAYITSIPDSVFKDENSGGEWDTYDYISIMTELGVETGVLALSGLYGHAWRMVGIGPDQLNGWGGYRPSPPSPAGIMPFNLPDWVYDPTNGTTSWGDIVRLGPREARVPEQYYQNAGILQ